MTLIKAVELLSTVGGEANLGITMPVSPGRLIISPKLLPLPLELLYKNVINGELEEVSPDSAYLLFCLLCRQMKGRQ